MIIQGKTGKGLDAFEWFEEFISIHEFSEIEGKGGKMKKYQVIVLVLLLIVESIIIAGCVTPNILKNTTTLPTQCPPTSANATSYIIINPIGNHIVGDVFEINGTTNLDVNSTIKIGIGVPPSSGGSPPRISYYYSTITGYATLQNATCGSNSWLYSVNLSGFHAPIKYLLTVWEEPNYSATNTTRFFVNPDQTKPLVNGEVK